MRVNIFYLINLVNSPAKAFRALCIFVLTVSVLRAVFYRHDSILYQYTDTSVVIQGTLQNIEASGTATKLTLGEIELANTTDKIQTGDKIIVYAPAFGEHKYGERISLRCKLEKPEPFDGFRFDRYLASKGVYATCFTRALPVVVKPAHSSVMHTLFQIRLAAIKHIDRTFGEPHASLLAGLLLGENRFTDVWQERFLRTGTTHIVAASGYNVSVAVMLAMGFFASLGLRRQKAFGFLLGAVCAYVVLAGAQAAVVRAGVMGILVLLARFLGRSSPMFGVILLTPSVMLLVNPLLLFDVGFQLSMVSTVALIYIVPSLERKFNWLPKTLEIRSSVTATLASTMAALPILLFTFRGFSFISVFANILVLPFVPYAMASGTVAVAFSWFSTDIAAYASGLSWAMLTWMLVCVRALGSLPLYAEFIQTPVALFGLAFWAVCCFFLWRLLQKNKLK